MNLLEEIEKVRNEGYNEANAQAKVCQDILLYGIAKGSLNRNVRKNILNSYEGSA